jgi:ketosteroid isomerase-like protein
MSKHVTVELLKEFLDAFNRHDLDTIMDFFADDCVFYMPRAAGPRGDRFVGKAGGASKCEGSICSSSWTARSLAKIPFWKIVE